jgi:hypothetical protein
MINFVNIENELSFQTKFGIPDKCYGLEIAKKNSPLDFQYKSNEIVSSFLAILVNSNGIVIDSINLSTSLIDDSEDYHICTGLIDYASNLDAGIYYFLVNSKYQSEYFVVVEDLIQGSLSKPPITVSGLEFYDTENDIDWGDKLGAPVDNFGIQFSGNVRPLPFIYLATDTVTSFKIINNTTGQEITLSTGLITSDSTYHICTGLIDYASAPTSGTYYFFVNDRYRSDIFCILEFAPSVNRFLLLETGDFLLLETGDRIILE